MSELPYELWNRIFDVGIETSKLGCRELCCLAIASRRLRRLSSDSSLWSSLIAVDFPGSKLPSSSPASPVLSKSSYRDRMMLALRRKAFFADIEVAACRMEMEALRSAISGESERLKKVHEELLDLERARSASVALNMEVKVCKQRLEMHEHAYGVEKIKLKGYREALESLTYHPVHGRKPTSNTGDNGNANRMRR